MRSALFSVAAFAGGAAVSFLNYLILLPAVKRENGNRTLFVSPVRSLLAAAYLFLLYFLGIKLSVSTPLLLISGALGLTVFLAVFTRRMIKALPAVNNAKSTPENDETNGENGNTDHERK